MPPLRMSEPRAVLTEAVRDTVRALQVDRVAAEVVRALQEAREASLLLKGAGTAVLLYAGGPGRNYADVDLLVPQASLAPVGEILVGLGFELALDDEASDAAERVHPHSQTWRRPGDAIEVDLHFTLPGVGVDRDTLWATLHAGRVALDLGELAVDVPAPEARALHVALHAWQHRGRHERSMRDLRRALGVLEPGVWRDAAALARSLDALEPLALALAAPGVDDAVARDLALPAPVDPLARLWMSPEDAEPAPGTIMLARLMGARGGRARARVVRELLLPPRIVLERTEGRALPGRRPYARAAGRRLAGAPAKLLPSLQSYRRARRQIESDR